MVELDVENLDNLIRYWRKERDNAKDEEDKLVARCYIDAFQTVRVNNGLKLLPKDE